MPYLSRDISEDPFTSMDTVAHVRPALNSQDRAVDHSPWFLQILEVSSALTPSSILIAKPGLHSLTLS